MLIANQFIEILSSAIRSKHAICRKVISLIIIIITLTCSNESSAQDLILNIRNAPEGVQITWIPVNDTLWETYSNSGYILTRLNAKGEKERSWQDIKPGSKAWFAENGDRDNGFTGILGSILYDEEMLSEEDLKGQNRYLRYHYLVPETQSNFSAAEVLGLGALDTGLIENQQYSYQLKVMKAAVEILNVTLDFTYQNGNFYFSNSNKIIQFDPPGGTPLIRMRPEYGHLNKIEMIAKAHGDSIELRWAPNHHVLWKASNIAGYYLYRVEYNLIQISEDEDRIDVTHILLDSIFPWKLDQFNDPEVIKDTLAMIAAESLYGDAQTTDEDGFLQRLTEQEMRYGMAMLAADRSKLAAQSLGLRFVDRNVEPGLSYRYILVGSATENVLENTSLEVENVKDSSLIINGAEIEAGDSWLKLTWSKLNDQIFSGYMVYKSEDGRNFNALWDVPLIVINNPAFNKDEPYSHLDSIGTNGKTFYYQIRGLDAFAEWSEPITLKGEGVDLAPPPAPLIMISESDPAGNIQLVWEMPEAVSDLAGFSVHLATSLDGTYEIVSGQLSAQTKSFNFNLPPNGNPSNYFIVQAVDQSGNMSASLPAFVRIVDSDPPAAPLNLSGMIDSSGKVTIVWDHVEANDLQGYRVYSGNHPDHEFSQLTIEPTIYNSWTDSTDLITLDKKIYYKVIAEDLSHNHSAFSEILELKRPDLLPPAAPASLPAVSDEKGIQINWVKSPSQDVVRYAIQRKEASQDSSNYQLIGMASALDNALWMDTTALSDIVYHYRVSAMDQSGLFSDWSFPVNGRKSWNPDDLKIINIQVKYDEALKAMYVQWSPTTNTNQAAQSGLLYYLYRKQSEEGWSKIRQLDAATFSYLDRSLKKDGIYSYAVKAVQQDGKSGELSVSNSVEFIFRK